MENVINQTQLINEELDELQKVLKNLYFLFPIEKGMTITEWFLCVDNFIQNVKDHDEK